MNIQILFSFLTYSIILIAIGYLFSKKMKSGGYALGNRSTNYIVTAIAMQASDMSHWLFLGLPAVVYSCGLIKLWEVLGLLLFMFLNWHFVAPKLRRATEKYKSVTLFSYFEKKYKDTTGIIRTVSSVITSIFLTFYISSGLVALGRLFENSFGLDYNIGILVGLITTIAYTLLGGFVAVAWCDFLQGIFALTMILLVPIAAYINIGGWEVISQAANAKCVSFSMLPESLSIWKLLSLLLLWGPGYFGQPQLLSFFMGIKNPKKIKYAKIIAVIWQTIALLAATCIGFIGIAYFKNGGETIYIQLTKTLFSPIVAGIILCAILAATLSTLDSYILTSGTVLAEDLYKKVVNKKAKPKKMLLISRLSSLLVSLAALIIAFSGNNSIYNLVKYGWSGMGSAFGPLVLVSLYSKKINKHGAIAGILTGAVTAALWPFTNIAIPTIIPGFILSTIAIFLTSKITKKNKKYSEIDCKSHIYKL